MIAKVLAVALVAQASAVSQVTFTCEAAGGAGSTSLIRYMVEGQYVDALQTCTGDPDSLINGVQTTLPVKVPLGARFAVFPLEAGITLTTVPGSTFCSTGVPTICQTASLTDTTLTIQAEYSATPTNTNNYAFIDCGRVTSGVTVAGTFRSNVANAAPAVVPVSEQFTCSQTTVVPPTSTEFTPFATIVGIIGFRKAATETTYEIAITDGHGAHLTPIMQFASLVDNDAAATSPITYTGTCALPTSFNMQSCLLTDTLTGDQGNSWSFPIVGGVVAVETCAYTCNAIGNQGACATTSANTDVTAICSAGAASFVSTDCADGVFTGGVVTCVFNDAQLTTTGFNNAITAINNSPNPQAAGAAFLAILAGSTNGGAYSNVCAECVAQALATGGSVNCAVCAAAQTRRQTVGLSVVFCPQADLAAQDVCLIEAACAGALNAGSVCFRAGVAIACPTCPVAVEESSSSKKGLLGLLGLLAIIPLVLILCSCCLLCVLLARKKKRAVLVPPPTIAPMTVAEPAIVCAGTAMPGMSPYGSAYPCY